MVVITIIAILGSMGFFAFDNALDRGRDNKRKQELKAVQGALTSYYQDNGHYPPECPPSGPPCANGIQVKTSDGGQSWFPEIAPYLKDQKLPNDPRQASLISQLAALIPKFGGPRQSQPPQGQIAGVSMSATSSHNVTAVLITGGVYQATLSHTTSGDNRMLIVGFASAVDAIASSVTYGGTALTFLKAQNNGADSTNVRVELWGLVNPPLGTNDIVITVPNAYPLSIGATSWTGVDQTTPLGTAVSAAATSTVPSISVTSATGETVVDIVGATNTTATVGAGQTQLWNLTKGSGRDSAGSSEPGAASVNMTWTLGASTRWAMIAVPLKPAPPNLTVTSVTTNKSSYTPGEAITITSTIQNSGSANISTQFFNGYNTNGPVSAPSCSSITWSGYDIFSLNAGASDIHNINTTAPLTPGTYRIGIYSDTNPCQITESSEADNYGTSATYTVASAPDTNIAPWTPIDLPNTVPAGTQAKISDGNYDLHGGGKGFWFENLQGRFAYQTISASQDFEITGRITNFYRQGGTISQWSRAGFVALQNIFQTNDSPYAFGGVTPTTNGAFFEYRVSGTATQLSGNRTNVSEIPEWLRLKKVGNSYSVYKSEDGTNFTQLGTPQTIPMTGNIYVGFVSSAEDFWSGSIDIAEFRSVSLTVSSLPSPTPNPPTPAPSPTPTPSASPVAGSTPDPTPGEFEGNPAPDSPPVSVAPSGANSPEYNCGSNADSVYCYIVSSDRSYYILWTRLDNLKDNQSVFNRGTHCRYSPPTPGGSSTNFNFCLEAQK